jgi:hypothetical protein
MVSQILISATIANLSDSPFTIIHFQLTGTTDRVILAKGMVYARALRE